MIIKIVIDCCTVVYIFNFCQHIWHSCKLEGVRLERLDGMRASASYLPGVSSAYDRLRASLTLVTYSHNLTAYCCCLKPTAVSDYQ